MVSQPPVGRRQFLVAGAAITGAALIGTGTLGTSAASAATSDEFDRLRRAWSDILTGGSAVNPADPDFATAIRGIDTTAADAIARYDNSGSAVYTDLPFTRGENATATYNRILDTAIAWATPGSRFHQVQSVADRLVNGLKVIGTKYYRPSQPQVGNWWQWQIGAPQALVNACAVLGSQVPAGDMASYMATVGHFDPDPTLNMTGANRTDKCQITIVRGILAKDAALITMGRDGLSDTFRFVTTSDGFYRDGGFVYHNHLPYAGHYGWVLLTDLSQLKRLLTGSSFPITDPNFANILNAIDNAYAPFMRDGLVMDVVRGRAISRQFETDHDAGHIITEAVIGLLPAGSPSQQARWRSMAKAWLTRETFAPILASATPARVAVIKPVLDDPSVVPAPRTDSHLQYPSIERAVHTRATWSWTVGIAGREISRYEAINGENKRGWHTADGATYLYNDDNGHYTDAYWPTVDSKRLAGVTVDSAPLASSVGQGTRPPNTFAGGAVLGTFGAVGIDLVPISSPMRARKSWFCLDDMVVALGAGITGGSGHPIETVVENRNLGAAGGNALTVDGQQQPTTLGWTARFAKAGWAHLDGVGGYVFPGGMDLMGLREARTGAWVDIDNGADTSGTATPFTRRYVTLWLDHGTAPSNASYAYLQLPGATAGLTALAAKTNPVQILANTAGQQAIHVTTLGLTAAVFFAAGSVGGVTTDKITASGPCTVLIKANTLAVADPTLTLSSVTLTVGHRAPITVDLTQGPPGTTHQVALP